MHKPTKQTEVPCMPLTTNKKQHAQCKPNKTNMSTIYSSSTHHSSNTAQHTQHKPNLTHTSSTLSAKLSPYKHRSACSA